jgi:hypothetical protein
LLGQQKHSFEVILDCGSSNEMHLQAMGALAMI